MNVSAQFLKATLVLKRMPCRCEVWKSSKRAFFTKNILPPQKTSCVTLCSYYFQLVRMSSRSTLEAPGARSTADEDSSSVSLFGAS